MAKKSKPIKSDSDRELPYSELRTLGIKFKALGYLIESQGGSALPPFDEQDLAQGLGGMMVELGEAVENVSRELEEIEIRKSQDRDKSNTK